MRFDRFLLDLVGQFLSIFLVFFVDGGTGESGNVDGGLWCWRGSVVVDLALLAIVR